MQISPRVVYYSPGMNFNLSDMHWFGFTQVASFDEVETSLSRGNRDLMLVSIATTTKQITQFINKLIFVI